MSWIKSDSPTFQEDLARFGITWGLNAPHGAGVYEVNPKRLRRFARISGLGNVVVKTGNIDQDINVTPGQINSDGTISAVKAKGHIRSSQSSLSPGDQVSNERFAGVMTPGTLRPHLRIEIDLHAIATALPEQKTNVPLQWSQAFDRRIKAEITRSSVQHNVLNATALRSVSKTAFPDDKYLKALLLAIYTKSASEILGPLTPGNVEEAVIAIPASIALNNAWGIAGALSKKVRNRNQPLQYSPTFTFWFMPLDRAIAGIGQRVFGSPVIRPARETSPDLGR